jgi:hypothetical protein
MNKTIKRSSYRQAMDLVVSSFLYDYPPRIKYYQETQTTPPDYDIKWKKDPEFLDIGLVSQLIAIYIDNEHDWSEFVAEAKDSDVIRTKLVMALNGVIDATELGQVMIAVAINYHKDRVVKEFTEKVEQEALLGERH